MKRTGATVAMINLQYINRRTGQTETETLSFSRVKQIIRAVKSEFYAYSRTRERIGYEATAIYHRRPDSPSGVTVATFGPDALVTEILRRNKQTSPLSPTEMQGNGRC